MRYARSGRHHIAYQEFGDGEFHLLFTPNWSTNVEIMWENPIAAQFMRRLASFSRVVVFDRRGSGLSDPVGLDEAPTLDDVVEDTLAVMDDAGVERAALVTTGLAAGLGLYFAATHPERTSALVLYNATARSRRADDYPHGMPDHLSDRITEAVETKWGREPQLGWGDDDPWLMRWQRLSLSPGAAVAAQRLYRDLDLRPVLPSIRVPTLVLHRTANLQMRIGHGRYLAEHIPGARLVELPGTDPTWYTEDNTVVADEIQQFLTGSRARLDRDFLVATVLVTDIVGSTTTAASVGNRTWTNLLDAHDGMVAAEIGRFGGRLVKSTGDGVLATFDSAVRAIECARAIRDAAGRLGVEIRAGLHTGECELRGDGDIAGLAVHVAARVEALAEPGTILVSGTVKDLVLGSDLRFEFAGEHELKGVPGTWPIWQVT